MNTYQRLCSLLLAVVVLGALAALPVSAAISQGDTVYTEAGGDSLTVANASDVILCAVWVGADQLTGIAFNGDAFTQLKEQVVSGNERVEVWMLTAPDVGTYTITRSMSGGASIQIRCAVYAGAEQALPTGTAIAATAGAGSTITVNPVSVVDESWAFASVMSSTTNIADGTNCDTPLTGLTDSRIAACDSAGSMSTAGTETVSAGGGGTMGIAAVVFSPYVAEEPPAETTTDSTTSTLAYEEAQLQNMILAWAVVLGVFAFGYGNGWKLWRR